MPHRSCFVEINNNSNYCTLTNARIFLDSGICEEPLPPMVGPCCQASAMFNKTTGAATGAVGVFTYDIFNPNLNDYSHILAVMFSVPYDRNLYSNWFAVGIFDRGTECNYDLYDIMYNGSEESFARSKGDGSCISYQGEYIIGSASMSEACEAGLKLEICDNSMY